MAIATKFFTTTSAKVATIPVVDGQVIALSDRDAWFYDMESKRHTVVGPAYYDGNLPTLGYADTLYVLGNASSNSGIYIWSANSSSYIKIAELSKEYSVFQGADGTSQGTSGLVPAPSKSDIIQFLANDGSWKTVEITDTKDTTGATATNDKILIVGAKTQDEAVKTYTNSKAYVSEGKVYSDGVETVNVSGSQALTNKTYEGYTLGNIVSKSIASGIIQSDENVPTSGQVYDSIQQILSDAKSYTDSAVADVVEFNIKVEDQLPETGDEHTIYLIPSSNAKDKNAKLEYLYIAGQWELIGSTEVDLSNYVTKEQMDEAIESVTQQTQTDLGLSIVDGKLCITFEEN